MAPEGRMIILPVLLLAVVATAGITILPQMWLKWLAGTLWFLTLFNLQFFRDPQRQLPDNAEAFVSPADGKVVVIKAIDHDEHIGGPAMQVSIFLSVFDVHVQKAPFDAVVDSTRYQRGKFLAAFNPDASDVNEQAVTYFSCGSGNFVVKQIAGLIARRILTYVNSGDNVNRGDRLGYIRYGSRVDVVLPSSFELSIKVGDRVTGSETVIGHFGKQEE